MFCPVTNTFQKSQNNDDRKEHTHDSDTIMLGYDINAHILPEAKLETIENCQSSLNVYRDLFGEPILQNACVANLESTKKSFRKTPNLKKNKCHRKKCVVSPVRIPDKVFFPTPEIMKIMKTSQLELQSLMGLSKNSNDVSVILNNSFDISGIQNLTNCSTPIAQKTLMKNAIINENNIDTSSILKGVFAFVDYKMEDDRSGKGIMDQLINLGAKIEKTFNRKVTHVVFYDGYRITYKKAIERKIPLVSARWVENCKLAKQILDPVKYPPVGMEKYTMIKERKPVCDIQKRIKVLKKSMKEKQLLEDNLKKQELKKRTTEEIDDYYKRTDMISIISEPLCEYLNVIEYDKQEKQTLELCGPPLSVKVIRKILTPKGINNTSTSEINTDLVKIEDRLKLNSQKRKRLRKLLFPSNEELLNMSINDDFSMSTQNLSINSLHKLSSSEKQIELLDIHTEKVAIENSFMTSEDSVSNAKVLQAIACTGMSKLKEKIIKLSIQNLGTFIFHTKLKPSTSYLVTKLKLVKTESFDIVLAMAFGCYIISEDWIHVSYKMGKWVPHEKYLISNLSEPVKEFQIKRQMSSSLLKFHIFDNVGRIYISDTCKPSAKQLKQLILACGGKCTNIENRASVVIGYTKQIIYNIHEKWILDCITEGKLLPKSQYRLANNNIP